MTKPIPDGFHSITPTLTVCGAASAIEFYKKAFGAQEIRRFPGPNGKSMMHAEIKIGDSRIMLSDESPQMKCLSPQSMGGATGGLFLYIENADDVFNKAVFTANLSILITWIISVQKRCTLNIKLSNLTSYTRVNG